MSNAYDALLVASFGGPEGPQDVLPFLENVLRGRTVPPQRLREVAEHYQMFGGRSPINEQNRQLVAAIQQELAEHGPTVPVYWGNRNWHPFLADTLRRMAADGVLRALALVTSAFASYSGCRQYREDIARAQAEVGPVAPRVDKLRLFYNHPGFIEPMVDRVRAALAQLPADPLPQLVFTAHSIPLTMAAGCRYEEQLREACRLVAAGVERDDWELAYQSRSGPPHQPWLEPDVGDLIEQQARGLNRQQPPLAAPRNVVVVPIGFLSDHMEVVYDLDYELHKRCDRLGVRLVRAATVGTHPRFVRMIVELIAERITEAPRRLAVGRLGPSHDECPPDCCPMACPVAAVAGAEMARGSRN
jgi:ferrochelatase